MNFVYDKWKKFCYLLDKSNIHSVTAETVLKGKVKEKYIVLKHDVETDVPRAYNIALIENSFGHSGSYYVQAYLLENQKNVELLKKMQDMGHEISYHYDVMDSCKGDIDSAIKEFEKNLKLFGDNGFTVASVCQHGNPVVERVGYTSNRDFFRNEKVKKLYPKIADIMVDFKDKAKTDYNYYSDAGRKFNLIYDPINNDIIDSSDKNIPFEKWDTLYESVCANNSIVSIHPHRWTKSVFIYNFKRAAFKIIKTLAKLLMHIPFCKKIMSRYYYLAKKI